MMLLTALAILAIIGLAAYCMVCERLAGDQQPDLAARPTTEPVEELVKG